MKLQNDPRYGTFIESKTGGMNWLPPDWLSADRAKKMVQQRCEDVSNPLDISKFDKFVVAPDGRTMRKEFDHGYCIRETPAETNVSALPSLHPNSNVGQCIDAEHESYAYVALGVLLDADCQVDAAGEHY